MAAPRAWGAAATAVAAAKVRLAKSNRINLTPEQIATADYNEAPVPLAIEMAREAHASFFAQLGKIKYRTERCALFKRYMEEAFRLEQWRDGHGNSFKNSYIRYLLGWNYDSNSPEGAVLKYWVESRFGLPPTYHGAILESRSSETYFLYERDHARGMGATNGILHQLDLIYEYTQWELGNLYPNNTHKTLYRGVYNFDEHRVEEELGGGRYMVWLNNLNSFSSDFERAWEFGDRVMEVAVPLPKIFFDGALLHSKILRGEEEVLVLGGQYEVRLCLY